MIPTTDSEAHKASRVSQNPRSDACIRIILALAGATAALSGSEPPPDLAKRVAERELACEQARQNYTYRQTVILEELDRMGVRRGIYREVRDIIFSPERKREEVLVGRPRNSLQNLRLSEEDFRDIREVQPFLFTPDEVWLYQTRYRGEETVDGVECYVLEVEPRQILQGQRLFDGVFWISKKDYSIVRTFGRAVPEIRTTKYENLFPRFTTFRAPVDGEHWFPAHTLADDVLEFRSGGQRIRLTIRYSNYKRFAAESVVTFGEAKK